MLLLKETKNKFEVGKTYYKNEDGYILLEKDKKIGIFQHIKNETEVPAVFCDSDFGEAAVFINTSKSMFAIHCKETMSQIVSDYADLIKAIDKPDSFEIYTAKRRIEDGKEFYKITKGSKTYYLNFYKIFTEEEFNILLPNLRLSTSDSEEIEELKFWLLNEITSILAEYVEYLKKIIK